MSERSDAIHHGAKPAVIDENYTEIKGKLYHKYCCCGCGQVIGEGSLHYAGTTFTFKDKYHLARWTREHLRFVHEDEENLQLYDRLMYWLQDDRHAWGVVVVALVLAAYVGLR